MLSVGFLRAAEETPPGIRSIGRVAEVRSRTAVRRLDAPHLLKDVFEERKFRDGKPVSAHQRKAAA